MLLHSNEESKGRLVALQHRRGIWRCSAPLGSKTHVALQYERVNKSMSLSLSNEHSLNNTGLPDLAAIGGLAEQEAQRRLKQAGYNELPASRKRSLFIIAFDVVREPMFLLLIAAGTVYLLLGDVREALVLIGSILVIMGITLYQEQKTERALEALCDLSSPRTLVIRGGEQQRIAGRDVVCGDIVVLAEGDRVPADGILLWSLNLSVDESLLTGEAVPVRKVAADRSVVPGQVKRSRYGRWLLTAAWYPSAWVARVATTFPVSSPAPW